MGTIEAHSKAYISFVNRYIYMYSVTVTDLKHTTTHTYSSSQSLASQLHEDERELFPEQDAEGGESDDISPLSLIASPAHPNTYATATRMRSSLSPHDRSVNSGGYVSTTSSVVSSMNGGGMIPMSQSMSAAIAGISMAMNGHQFPQVFYTIPFCVCMCMC